MVALIVDRLQADPERAVVEMGAGRPRGAVGQGEGRLARAADAVQPGARLQDRGVAEQVDRLPEGDRLGPPERDLLRLPPGEVLGIERDLEARLLAERPHDVGKRGPVEVEPDAGGLGQERALDPLDQAGGAGPDLRVARAARRPQRGERRAAEVLERLRGGLALGVSAGAEPRDQFAHVGQFLGRLPAQHDQQELNTEHHRHPFSGAGPAAIVPIAPRRSGLPTTASATVPS